MMYAFGLSAPATKSKVCAAMCAGIKCPTLIPSSAQPPHHPSITLSQDLLHLPGSSQTVSAMQMSVPQTLVSRIFFFFFGC